MSYEAYVEYRVPVPLHQDAAVQDLTRRLARERHVRRVTIRQVVREALDLFVQQHESNRAVP